MGWSGELVVDTSTRLKDLQTLRVFFKPNAALPAYSDCPKVIQDAVSGKTPAPKFISGKSLALHIWPYFVALGLGMSLVEWLLIRPKSLLLSSLLVFVCFAVMIVPVLFHFPRLRKQRYSHEKELFGAFEANPDLYRDEIFKAAITRLPYVDFYGKHVTLSDKSKVGRFEAEVIDELRKLGIRQEVSVANRGRPFLIHQYELTELGWKKWENGDSKNYVLDIAILWPERRIKYNIEIDDPSHTTRRQKDINRDKVLTDRGWFTRRLNHNFLKTPGNTEKAAREIVALLYFFAKYANEQELEFEQWWRGKLQNAEFRTAQKAAHGK
ncbi:DUF559 domain-containing protein [bacterium]|nr:DUF559 domain-containing protein [bacterium]